MKKLLLLGAILLLFLSCTDAGRAKFGGFGDDFKIEILSSNTGEVIKTYYSSGKVLSEGQSDGYFFYGFCHRRIDRDIRRSSSHYTL